MNFFVKFLPLILFISCSLFEVKKVSQNISTEIGRVCLSSEGAGRLMVGGHKLTFKFNSAVEHETQQWFMSMVFPLYGEETFIVEWDKSGLLNFEASFENKILQSKDKVDPEALHLFLEKWAKLIIEIARVQKSENRELLSSDFNWSASQKLLKAQSTVKDHGEIILEFKNLTAKNYFGRYDLFMQSSLDKSIKLELIVRKCLEKAE